MTLIKGQKLDWGFITTWTYRIFVAGVAAGGLYAASTFATKVDMDKANEPYRDLPPRVQALERASSDRSEALRKLAEWQVKKDEVDTRLTVLVENQQRLIDRQQQLMDRQQSQIDDLNRRTTR